MGVQQEAVTSRLNTLFSDTHLVCKRIIVTRRLLDLQLIAISQFMI